MLELYNGKAPYEGPSKLTIETLVHILKKLVWWVIFFSSLGNLDLTGPKQVFKAENNPWVTPIADQFQLGISHVFEYVRSETYK